MDDTRSERIARAEEGLAEMQAALDHAKRHPHFRSRPFEGAAKLASSTECLGCAFVGAAAEFLEPVSVHGA